MTDTPEVPAISLTIDDAVRATGLSRTLLYVALAEGKLAARKAGRRTLIEHAELEAFVRSLPRARYGRAA